MPDDLTDIEENNYLRSQVEPEDFIKFGMIPEFIGRLPVLTALDELDKDSLTRVLTEPRNAITKQFKKLFSMQGQELEFTDTGLEEIASQAIQRKSGARGLRGIVEKIMLDTQFDLPSITERRCFVVDDEVVKGGKNLIDSYRKVKKDSGPAAA
ncbi:MAG: ATP-dependent Clp protease ATP-binding subunit ClpX, partial [Planctomycetota bacterium]|jgi:ATP-dependent Clp protease ATP-binding subunit ClpX